MIDMLKIIYRVFAQQGYKQACISWPAMLYHSFGFWYALLVLIGPTRLSDRNKTYLLSRLLPFVDYTDKESIKKMSVYEGTIIPSKLPESFLK